ncbi:hypothetical protein BSKO_04905 [Bryopsis sp. KO-2023]|nr:hypothetical protein BSKO_04905 [Bryopsis sp. KO-2023]
MDRELFRESFAAGVKDVVYPVLKWVLPQHKQLQKRAFVGYYLSFPDMPDEMLHDPDIMALREEVVAYQQEFIELHKESERVKDINRDPLAVKQKIKQQEEERGRLQMLIKRASQKVEGVANLEELQVECTALQKHQDMKITLATQVVQQKQALEKSRADHLKASRKIKEMKSGMGSNDHGQILKSLMEEANSVKTKSNVQLVTEKEQKEHRLNAIQEVASGGPISEGELQRLQNRVNQLNVDIRQITEHQMNIEKDRAGDPAMLQLRQAQQMANLIQKKKSEVMARMERLKDKKMALGGGRGSDDGDFMGADSGVDEEEWRAQYEEVKGKLPTYKQMKRELSDIEAELLVLSRTEEILKEREQNARAVAEQMGLSDLGDESSYPMAMSEDYPEGASIGEIKKLLSEANAKLKERKVQMAPQIRELRTGRQNFQTLEAEHEEKKKAYDAVMVDLESRIKQLEHQILDQKEESAEVQKHFHLSNCQMHMLDNDIRRFTGTDAYTIKEKYTTAIRDAEIEYRELKDKQRKLKEVQGSSCDQKEMLMDLKKLLEMKLNMYQGGGGLGMMSSGQAMGGTAQSFQTETGNVMVL